MATTRRRPAATRAAGLWAVGKDTWKTWARRKDGPDGFQWSDLLAGSQAALSYAWRQLSADSRRSGKPCPAFGCHNGAPYGNASQSHRVQRAVPAQERRRTPRSPQDDTVDDLGMLETVWGLVACLSALVAVVAAFNFAFNFALDVVGIIMKAVCPIFKFFVPAIIYALVAFLIVFVSHWFGPPGLRGSIQSFCLAALFLIPVLPLCAFFEWVWRATPAGQRQTGNRR